MDLIKLQHWLTQHYPGCFLIPAQSGKKAPKYPHKNGQYNAEKFLESGYRECQHGCLIILTQGLIIIDIDDHDYVNTFLNVPAFAQTVSCQTKKGRHFYFNRTPACDGAGIYDSSRGLIDKDEALPVDIKTCNRNPDSAPGTITIPPSPDKSWVVPPIDNPILDLPDKFVEFYQKFLVDSKKTGDIKQQYPGIISPNYTREDLQKYLDMLKPFRYDEWQYWIRVGFALHSHDPNLLDLWDSWSQKSVTKYDGKCWRDWKTMNNPYAKKCTLATLFYFARQDDPEAFTKLHGKPMPKKLLKPEDKTVIRDFIGDNYHYTPNKIPDDNIEVYYYADAYYIAVNVDEPYCKISQCVHEKPRTWINIGLTSSSEKCRECYWDRIHELRYRDYSPELKRVYNGINPEIASKDNQSLIGDYFRKKEKELPDIDKMNLIIKPNPDTMFGYKYDFDQNYWCIICRRDHDDPSNFFILNQERKICICCNKASMIDARIPHDGLDCPENVYNFLIQLNVQYNITNIQNNYYGNTDTYDDSFDNNFDIFPDKQFNHLMNRSFKGYATDIARVFLHLSDDLFGIQFSEKDSWWSWDDMEKRWIKASHKAHIFCDEIVAEKYHQAISWFKSNISDENANKRRLTKLDGIIKRLKDRDQNSILSQVAILLKDKYHNFENIMDSNKNIINFRGTIFDFETLEFTEAQPKHMISRSTNYKLPDINLQIRSDLMKFIESIMPDKKNIDYLMIWLASSLDGWNREESFHILTGLGRNGKGVLRDLMQNALNGDNNNTNGYCAIMSSTFMTNERPSSDRPVADLMNLKGKRFLVASEPDDDRKINVGFVKFLSGNDPINGRWLQSNDEIIFQPQYTLALLCNNIPKITGDDEAIWMRSRFIHFPYVFTEFPMHDNEKPIDMGLKPRITNQGPQFMLILLEYYKRYKKYGLKPTPEILKMTQIVRDENDCYQEFINTKLQRTENDNDRLKQSKINKECKDWIAKNYNTTKFSKLSLTKTMEKNFGKCNKSIRFSDNSIVPGWYKLLVVD